MSRKTRRMASLRARYSIPKDAPVGGRGEQAEVDTMSRKRRGTPKGLATRTRHEESLAQRMIRRERLEEEGPLEGRRYEGYHPTAACLKHGVAPTDADPDAWIDGLGTRELMAALTFENLKLVAATGRSRRYPTLLDLWRGTWDAETDPMPPSTAPENVGVDTPSADGGEDWEAHPERYVSLETEVLSDGSGGTLVFGVIGARMWLGDPSVSKLASCDAGLREPLLAGEVESRLDQVRAGMVRELRRLFHQGTGLLLSEAEVSERMEFRAELRMDGTVLGRMANWLAGRRTPGIHVPVEKLTAADIKRISDEWNKTGSRIGG